MHHKITIILLYINTFVNNKQNLLLAKGVWFSLVINLVLLN